MEFEDAVNIGIARAVKTLKNVQGAWIQDQEVRVDGDQVVEYRVDMKLTFVVTDQGRFTARHISMGIYGPDRQVESPSP